MFNPITGRVSKTRDVIFLDRMYYTNENSKETGIETIIYLETPGYKEVEDDNYSPDIKVREGDDDADPLIAKTEINTEPE